MVIFVGVNKNGEVSLHTVEPVRNESAGTWESLRPYVNSFIHQSIDYMIKHSKMTWQMEPEFIDINLNKNTEKSYE